VWKTTTEIEQQQETAADVAWYFNSHSYVTDNYQGEGTMRSNILAQIGDSEQNYDKAAIVYFDHGIGDNKSYPPYYEPEWHYSVYDNIGTPAFDDEIYLNTTGKTFFAFISTCMSARITQGQVNISGVLHAIGYPTAQGKSPTDHAVGMAYAFTHQIVGSTMSDNGYDYPDSESFCYIGFPWGSPSLSQLVDPENHPSSYYCQWVERFFYYALANDWSVNYALDQASLYCFSDDFGGTALHNGFCPVWAEPWDDDDSTMVVYGNGNIHLYQPPTSIKVVAYGWNGQFYTNTDTDVWIDGQYAGSTNYMYITKNVATGNHTVQVGSSAPGGPFRFFAGYPWYENPITVYVGSETQTQVECGYFPMLKLDISAGTGGTTNPSGTQYHQPLNTTYVTATADEDHIFDHWLLDGANEGSNPTIEVYMDDDRTLQAVFRDKEHSLTVLAYNQYQQGAVPYWVDDEYIGLTDGSSITVLDGNHKIEVDTPLYQYPYVHVFCYYEVFYGPTYYDNPVTLSITDDETIIAWYYTDYY
jgi:hypothetical protein